MSSLPKTDRQDSWVTTMMDLHASTWHRPAGGLVVAVSRDILDGVGIDAPVGDVGVAMCFMPQDISLRAYAHSAIRTAAEHVGFEVVARREVPTRPVPRHGRSTLPHISQVFIQPVHVTDPEDFEQELQRLRGLIEGEMVLLGLTDDDFRLVSCSARAILYATPDEAGDATSFYPDLADAPSRREQMGDFRRGLTRA